MAYLLHQLLAKSARRRPDGEAVAFNEERLTYRELDRLSNQLAHALRAGGVERGDRVGIYLSKSPRSVVAIFGVLKAGAAYVPLDPAAPPRRVAFMIANCAMKALVSTPEKLTGLGPALAGSSSLECVVLTGEEGGSASDLATRVVRWREVLAAPAEAAPLVEPIEHDLAYVLYTSGSTGEPKGVMLTHRAALTFVDWAVDCFRVVATDRLSNHAPLHFDLSIFDIFAAVEAGATVVPVPEELSVFPRNLAEFIEERRITIWYSVPSVLTRLVLYGGLDRQRFAALRAVLFAGEVFPVKYLRQLRALIPHAEYHNLYGPTETNVCTYYTVSELPADRTEPLPIGKACANTEVFAVNDRGLVAGPGEVGELHVRGPSLLKGYWGLPDKTREVLVPHPTDPTSGERVYRTGDLVKQEADGHYRFLGRRDSMVKSRGYRIELGEIETALYNHPAVEEAAAIAIPHNEVGALIKAVVVPRSPNGLSKRELEGFCGERIPRYMIPALIEFRAALPKTSTGKVDRALLLAEHLQAGGERRPEGDP